MKNSAIKSPPPTKIVPGTSADKKSAEANKNQTASNKANPKGKNIVASQPEEEIQPPPPKEKNLERFIHVTTYNDSETMKILKELFETINKEAYKLKSVKEIYTRTLSPEELDDNNIDYISGFQVIDHNLRITILEGITGKAMSLIKEKLPKLELNTDKKKIFSNSKILFDKRIYSNFNLCLKFIKLRNSLSHILNTPDIYLKANKYREIFNAFMQLGFILQSPTFESITNANLFPTNESLSQLERKYADIINDEDLSGIHNDKKKKKKILNNEKNVNTTNSAVSTDNNLSNLNYNILPAVNRTSGSPHLNNTINNKNDNIAYRINQSAGNRSRSPKKENRVPKLDSFNFDFIKKKKDEIGKSMSFNRKENFMKTHKINSEFIHRLNKKNVPQHFWVYEKMTPMENIISSVNGSDEGANDNNMNILKNHNYSNVSNQSGENFEKQQINIDENYKGKEHYMYSQQNNNMFNKHLNELREKYAKDKNNYYTYSMDYLTLSFPMKENKNSDYEQYLQNKNAWISKKDFDNYKQLNKEFHFYPKKKIDL